MVSEKADLLKIIDQFKAAKVLVVGDLIVDHYVWGKVSRISPEAPVVVVHVTEEEKRLGGAGNVARNLVTLGAKAAVCGVVGDDEAGRGLLKMLEEIDVDCEGVLVDRSRTTTQKSRVIAHKQQVVRIDREVVKPLASTFSEGIAAAIQSKAMQSSVAGVGGIIVSDYGKGTVCEALFSKIRSGFENKLLGFGKLPVLVDPKAPNFSIYSRSTVIKPNRAEAEEASGMSIKSRSQAIEAGRKLIKQWSAEMVLITLGEDGMVLVSDASGTEPVVEVDTVAQDVFDVSGAGDTVSAVFLLALSVGASPRQAAILSNHAAGIVVAEVGTVAVSADELRKRISEAS